MRQLSALDAQFLAMEDGRVHGHISGLSIYAPEREFTLQTLLEHIESRLALVPPFRERLVEVPLGLDHPYWVIDPNFDLEYHVREIALSPPGDDAQLAEQCARLHARPLDRSRPLWECYLITGLASGHVAICTKIHHAAVDGLSGAEVMLALTDTTPDGSPLLTGEHAEPNVRLPSQWAMLGRGLRGLPKLPLKALEGLPRTLQHLDENPALRILPGVSKVAQVTRRVPGLRRREPAELLERPRAKGPRTRFNGPVSAHRRFAFTTLPLADLKAVRKRFGVTVNDVIVALCTGAVRSWLAANGELPDEPLTAMVPLSVRTRKQRGTFGNRISLMVVPIPTDEPDAAVRVEKTSIALSHAKALHRGIPASVLQDMSQFVPPALTAGAMRVALALLSRTSIEPLCNLVVSNVPGSPKPLYLAGAKMLAHYPISPIAHGVGLNITVVSYEDKVDVGIVCDRDIGVDPWELADAITDELTELNDLVDTAPAPTAIGRGTPRVADIDGDVHWIDFGGPDGAPLVLCVHGLGATALSWMSLAHRMTHRVRVVAIDLIGHGRTRLAGRSSAVPSNRMLVDRFIREVLREPVVLVGNSMGGAIAMLEAAESPDVVNGVVLIDPAVPRNIVGVDLEVARRFAVYAMPGLGEGFMRLIDQNNPPEQRVRDLLELCCVDTKRVDAEAIAAAVELETERNAYEDRSAAFLAAARSILWLIANRAAYADAARRVKAPVLMLAGAEDRLIPLDAMAALARANPHWRFEVAHDIGHTPQFEAPQWTADEILRWIDTPKSARRRRTSA